MTIEAMVTSECNDKKGLLTFRNMPSIDGPDDIHISVSADETKVVSVSMKREEFRRLLDELVRTMIVWDFGMTMAPPEQSFDLRQALTSR